MLYFLFLPDRCGRRRPLERGRPSGPLLLLQCEAHETADFFNREGFFDDVPWVEEFGDVQKTPGICRTAQGNDIGLHEFTRRARG